MNSSEKKINEKYSNKKNAIVIIIDSLRFDTLSDLDKSKLLFPNLSNFFSKGLFTECVTNSNSTQFVLPALFSQSYPLDYGGYDAGIRNRPKTFVELLKENGYQTCLISNANQIGLGDDGYKRGFDHIKICPDFRTVIEQKIFRYIKPKIDQLDKDDSSGEKSLSYLNIEYEIFIKSLIEGIKICDKSNWPNSLLKVNETIAKNCHEELKILKNNPKQIKIKIKDISPGVYWKYLGRTKLKHLLHKISKIYNGIGWRLRKYISRNPAIFPFILLGHISVKSDKLIDRLLSYIQTTNSPWFFYCHLMDLHDGRDISDISFFLRRLPFLPKWLLARIKGITNRRFMYDSTLMLIDKILSKFINKLLNNEDIVTIISADHGLRIGSAWPQRSNSYEDKFLNMFQEDITVPFCIHSPRKFPKEFKLLDSMGISATLLDALDIRQHESFKGRSLYGGGRNYVISEHAGRGHSDVEKKDLYFAVTSPEDKLFINFKKNTLNLFYYDLQKDLEEKKNLIFEKIYDPKIKKLLKEFILQRGEILKTRIMSLTVEQHEEFVHFLKKQA